MPTTTQVRTSAGPPGAVWLRRPSVRVLPERPDPEPSTVDSRFLSDYLAEFGLKPDWELYTRGGGNSFVHMSRELLDGLDRPLPALDVALLAFHLPDMKVVEVAGSYLAGRCAGSPAVFSVAGQGVGAPFTALHILSCMRLAGELANGAVFVLDQSTIPYRDPDTHDGAVRDRVALLCTDTVGADGAAVLDFIDEQPVADPADALVTLTHRLPGVRIVAGRMLADRLDPAFRARHGIVVGARRGLCTSAWAGLDEHWPRDQYTVVADHDPHAGRLFQAGLRPGAWT
jgi:hypothetical protein